MVPNNGLDHFRRALLGEQRHCSENGRIVGLVVSAARREQLDGGRGARFVFELGE